jgi:predicted nucleic-acid-binding Zn-ribbon protein
MPQSTKCPKCGGSMEKGVIPDQGHGRVFMNHWQLGRETGWLGGLRSRNQTRYEIAAYRCTKCGFLEQYATEPKSW